MKISITELLGRNRMYSLALEYDPPVISKRTGEPVSVERLQLTTYRIPEDERQVKYNRVMLEKAEAIRMFREQQIKRGEILVYKIEKKDDFVAFYRKKAAVKSAHSNYTAGFKVFENFVGGSFPFKDVGHDLFVRYRDYLAALPNNPMTGRPMTYLTARGTFNQFRYMLTEAYNDGFVDRDYRDCDEILHERPSNYLYLVTDDDIRKLMETRCPREDVVRICKIILHTGLRYKEIMKLRWQDIFRTEDGRAFISRKLQLSGRQSDLYISNEIYEVFGKPKKKGYVFDLMHSSASRNQALKKWAADAGVDKNITFESFRRYISEIPFNNNKY